MNRSDFGFIEPAAGGQEIFVHVKAFVARSGRPQVGQRVTFEVELNPQGKKRASRVQLVRTARVAARRRNDSPAQWGTATILAIPAFVLLYVAIAVLWRVPNWVGLLYLGASAVCLVAYKVDKSGASAGESRIPESTLHLLGLVGGWPGAILAQQFLRHKSVKTEFRSKFWATVVINVVGFVALASPLRSLVPV